MKAAWLVKFNWIKGGTVSNPGEVVVVGPFEAIDVTLGRLDPPKHYTSFEPLVASVERLPDVVGLPPDDTLKNTILVFGSMTTVPIEHLTNADAVIRVNDDGSAFLEKWRLGLSGWELRTFGPLPNLDTSSVAEPPSSPGDSSPRVLDLSETVAASLTMDDIAREIGEFKGHFNTPPESVRLNQHQALELIQSGTTLFGIKIEVVHQQFDDDTRLLKYFGALHRAAEEVVGVPMNPDAIDRLGDALVLPPDIEAAVEGPRGR